jgi:hypothetical protein
LSEVLEAQKDRQTDIKRHERAAQASKGAAILIAAKLCDFLDAQVREESMTIVLPEPR